jgi:hypothetical protein
MHSGYPSEGNIENTSLFEFLELLLDPFEIAIDVGSHWAEGWKEIAQLLPNRQH